MPGDDLLEHGKDVDHWIVTSSDWNTHYAEKSNMLDEFKSVKGEILFDHKGGPSMHCLSSTLIIIVRPIDSV